MKNKNETGDCFSVHAKAIIREFTTLTLVHGVVTGQGALKGVRFAHCWLEEKNTVIDMSNGKIKIIPLDIYYKTAKIRNETGSIHKYSLREAAKMLYKYEHYGPWEIIETEL